MSLVKFNVTRISPKWTLNSSANLQSGSDNLPGFEFNVDGTYKGMLVETASRNLCLQSEDINTTWSPNNATPALSTETTPDGDSTNKYIKLAADDGTGTGFVDVDQSFTGLTGGAKYTASVFLKAGGLSFAQVSAINYDTNNTDGRQYFGLSGDGSLGTASNLDDSNIEKYPNGWYRCSITWTQGASHTTAVFRIYLAISNSDAEVPIDGTSSIFVWGAQLEKGDKASSYIKTTNETKTRNEDVITLTSASQYLPSEGKVTLGWEQREDDTIYIGALSASVASGSRELVYEYSSTEQTLSIDGTEVQTVTGQFDFSNMNEIQLGHVNGLDQPNTHLKYFAVE